MTSAPFFVSGPIQPERALPHPPPRSSSRKRGPRLFVVLSYSYILTSLRTLHCPRIEEEAAGTQKRAGEDAGAPVERARSFHRSAGDSPACQGNPGVNEKSLGPRFREDERRGWGASHRDHRVFGEWQIDPREETRRAARTPCDSPRPTLLAAGMARRQRRGDAQGGRSGVDGGHLDQRRPRDRFLGPAPLQSRHNRLVGYAETDLSCAAPSCACRSISAERGRTFRMAAGRNST